MSSSLKEKKTSHRQLASNNASGNYHHGDLRNSLVLAAFDLIAQDGPDSFALIDAARAVGVSSAAPYRHFRDKDELLQAVTEHGFNSMHKTIELVTQNKEPGSIEHILTIGEQYLSFITNHSGLFSLMWGEQGRLVLDGKDWRENERTAFNQLISSLEIWLNSERITNQNSKTIATMLWSAALGLATLSISKQLNASDSKSSELDLLRQTTISILKGFGG